MQIGPLRCWPGGLCLSRSIGDMDVGEFIVPVPYVKQMKVFFYLLPVLIFSVYDLDSIFMFSFLISRRFNIY